MKIGFPDYGGMRMKFKYSSEEKFQIVMEEITMELK